MWRPLQVGFQRWWNNLADTSPPTRDKTVKAEQKYRNLNYVGSFRKGLPTTQGVVNAKDYELYLQALARKDFTPLAGIARNLAEPLGAYVNDLFGPESSCTVIGRPPAALDSLEMTHDMEELYAMALLRDVPFIGYHQSPGVSKIAALLNTTHLFQYRELPGPFISQLLLLNKWKALKPQNYLTSWPEYDKVHSGDVSKPLTAFLPTPRYITTLRDLAAATWVDYPVQFYQEAALWLSTNHPKAFKTPFTDGITKGFLTFQTPFTLDLLNKVTTLALRSSWYHKWLVHRAARPEEVGAEVERLRTGLQSPYTGQPNLLTSEIVKLVVEKQGSAFLSSAFPDGSPLHPSYPAGHAVIAGAAVTILKALTDYDYLLSPLVPDATGQKLVPGPGPNLKLGDEINKLADNVGVGRSAAGVHFRHDNTAGLILGEKLALRVLVETKRTLVQREIVFRVKLFDGSVREF